MVNEPILKRTFLRDEVYATLQEWIMTGKLEPGQRLRDQDLSEMLGISRTPIREALLKLEDEGFVETKANRSTSVTRIDLNQVEHVYSIVWTLEALALEQAFPNISDHFIETLQTSNRHLEQTANTNNQPDAIQADNEFHDRIVRLSNNEELCVLLANLKAKIRRAELHYFRDNDAMKLSLAEHEEIIQALKARELERAKAAITNNWKKSLERMKFMID